MTKISRSDRALLASAWRRVSNTPKVRFRKPTTPFRAQYGGFCGRCGREIENSQMIQCHRDFDGAVHIGCDAPEVIVRTLDEAVIAPPPRGGQPPLCTSCHLEHVGGCF